MIIRNSPKILFNLSLIEETIKKSKKKRNKPDKNKEAQQIEKGWKKLEISNTFQKLLKTRDKTLLGKKVRCFPFLHYLESKPILFKFNIFFH